MDEETVEAGIGALRQDGPPALERNRDRARAQALDRVALRPRRAVRDDDRAGDSEPPRAPRDALRHVARARRPHPGGEPLRGQAEDRVRRAAELERPDRLQALELEVDLAAARIREPHERRADGRAGDAAPRLADRV